MLETRVRTAAGKEIWLVRVDLDADGAPEYVLLRRLHTRLEGELYFQRAGDWQRRRMRADPAAAEDADALADALANGALRVVPPRFGDLAIGDVRVEIP